MLGTREHASGTVKPSPRSLKIDRKLELDRPANDNGCTPIDRPGPRWSGFVYKLRSCSTGMSAAKRVVFPEVLFAHKGLGERMTPIEISTIAIPVGMLTCRGITSLNIAQLPLSGGWSVLIGCVYRNLNTGVVVMKSAQDGK
jgi:hypothetical protein